MARKCILGLMIAALLASFTLPALAQESTVKGNLAGTIYDTSGAVVPGAKVTISGPTGTTSKDSDERGDFSFPLLIPGFYSVKVEKEGFKAADVKSVEVFTNRTSGIRVTLEPGAITQVVEISVPAVTVDTSSTGVGANLADSFYQQVPVQRNIAGLFYLSAGVASGGLSGGANPSISGGSGLENLYVADGVNITDSAFGGLGVFSRFYSSLGTGITLSFVKEVQVKTGGYEPQYGKATGGIVQIVTKSGSRDYHGAIAGYFSPQEMEADRKQPDDAPRFNRAGKMLHQGTYDASAEVGGYVPSMRDKFFFFGSFNPSYVRDFGRFAQFPDVPNPASPTLFTNSLNYAGKLTYRISEKHQVEGSVFGDPSHTSTGPFRTLAISNNTATSKLEYGTRNVAARWNGTLSPTWLVNASFTWGFNEFKETGFANTYGIINRTQTGLDRLNNPLPDASLAVQRGIHQAIGLGALENTESNTYGFNVDTSKQYHFGGDHTFSIGYRLERPFFEGLRARSGPAYITPTTNATGRTLTSMGVPANLVGQPAQTALSLRLASPSCTLCPLLTIPGFASPQRVFLRGDRNEIFFPLPFKTEGTTHTVYAMDSWSPNRYVTMNLGLRWEQQHMKGEQISYTWTDNWSPRIGVIADPWGNRKTKVYANFGRYNYGIPLDMAERSLTNEVSILSLRWAPQFTVDASGNRIATINSFGTVTPVFDAAHLLNRATGGTGGNPFPLAQSTTGIAAGTKMEYVDEFVVGVEREFKGGVIVSARYIDRRMKRIVEDVAGLSPEAGNSGIEQLYLITNPSKTLDIYTNERPVTFQSGSLGFDANGNVISGPAACFDGNDNFTPFWLDPVENSFGQTVAPGGVCFPAVNRTTSQPWIDPVTGNLLSGVLFGGEPVPDGKPDGFPNPIRNYWAVEFEVNKAFSHNWQMRANWRIAKLFGNFEGAFRNDNGQTDPSISSLFDFTEGIFGLLGDQFKPGVLNTDKRHIVNFYSSYVLDRSMMKGLELGVGVRLETGAPINDLKAHPTYLNSGEVPVGGRGALGRLPTTGTVDIHVAYPFRLAERMKLKFGMDLFNIANAKRQLRIDQFEDSSFGVKNVDFLKPVGRGGPGSVYGYQRPFYARAMVRLEF